MANISYRIPPQFWLQDEKFSQLLELLKKYRTSFDDVALFWGSTHSIRNLTTLKQESNILRKRLEFLRSEKIPCGINLLTLIGHHKENISEIPSGLSELVDLNGNSCVGSLCPNSHHNQLNYFDEVINLLVECKPDYIWLDDDIRLYGHGDLRLVCFCNECLEKFNRIHGQKFTHLELEALFNSLDTNQSLYWRKRWLNFSGNNLKNFFTYIENTVHRLDSTIELGVMDAGLRPGDSASLENLALAIKGNSNLPIRWRPGGGAYTDKTFDAFIDKAHYLGMEAAYLPAFVTNIQAEVENFNYQRLNKSIHATVLESSLYIASGNTGCSFNILDPYDDLSVFEPLIDKLTQKRQFFNLQSQYSKLPLVGVYNAWCPENSAGAGIANNQPWINEMWN